MSSNSSSSDRPVGPQVPLFEAKWPTDSPIEGDLISLKKLTSDYAEDLFNEVGGEENSFLWDYMGDGPYPNVEALRESLEKKEQSKDPWFYVIILKETNKPVGYVSYLEISTIHRGIEIGHILYSTKLQRTKAATEIQYLMAKTAFEDLGYRRLQWKCNSLNYPSRKAALRLGYSFEGVLRHQMIIKGRNRDTAYYSILDSEWPPVKEGFISWLSDENFDESGNQIKNLRDFRSQ